MSLGNAPAVLAFRKEDLETLKSRNDYAKYLVGQDDALDVDAAFHNFVHGTLDPRETEAYGYGLSMFDRRSEKFGPYAAKESFGKTLEATDTGVRRLYDMDHSEPFLSAYAPAILSFLYTGAPDASALGRLTERSEHPVSVLFGNARVAMSGSAEAHQALGEVARTMKRRVLAFGIASCGDEGEGDWSEMTFVIATCLALGMAGMDPPAGLGEVVEACVEFVKMWLGYKLKGARTLESCKNESECLFAIGTAIEEYKNGSSRDMV